MFSPKLASFLYELVIAFGIWLLKETFMRDDVVKAAEILARWGVVALPTETVYGLAADARNEFAVKKIFNLKGRPSFNPLIVHVKNLQMAEEIGEFSPLARRLATVFWPGPLTLVVPLQKRAGICSLVTAGRDTIALRAPMHPLMQMVLNLTGLALAAPSANMSGSISPTTADHVRTGVPDVDFIVDGGATMNGIESTIVQVREADAGLYLLRPGPVTVEALEAASGLSVEVFGQDEAAPLSPGALSKHYAPRARVRLEALDVCEGEGVLGFGEEKADVGVPFFNLSGSQDLLEAAQKLYAGLHWLDEQGVEGIAVRPIPLTGIGAAINDRLRRAAAEG